MFKREIPPDAVVRIIGSGEIVSDYPNDTPYPSVLLLGFQAGDPVHVVVARDNYTGVCYVVTVYRPDSRLWNADFKTRREV